MIKTIDDLIRAKKEFDKHGGVALELRNDSGKVKVKQHNIFDAYKELVKKTKVKDGQFYICGHKSWLFIEIEKGGIKNEKESI